MPALLVGCGGGTRDVKLAFVSTKRLNSDEEGAALPVMVRVYQLQSKDKFEQATFKSLWKNDKEFLGEDLLERKDITLHPDSEVVLDLEVETKKGANYLGVMALFRQPEGDSWRKVLSSDLSSMVPFKTPVVRLILDQNSVTIEE